MTARQSTIEWFDANTRRITAFAAIIAAPFAMAATILSAQPTKAELPQEQMEAITTAAEQAGDALGRVEMIERRMASLESVSLQRKPIIGCSVRSFDRLFGDNPRIPRPCLFPELPD